MSDFRQTAIDAILEDLDFDSVKELRAYVSKNKQDDYFYGGILHAINAVQDLPSTQPEIIRCKDCKYSEHWYRDKSRCFLWHEEGIDVFEDGFCNYVERRTDSDGRD